MGDNPFDRFGRPRRRNYLLEAALRKPDPQPPTAPPRPRLNLRNPLLNIKLEPPYYFRDAKDELKIAVWRKGKPILGYDPNVMRYDSEGSIMLFSQHGNCESDFGWQIDHIHPKAKGGSDELFNLQPLNWRNNQRKKDKVTLLPPPVYRR